MRICDDLRQAVLQAAIQGKLTKQLPEDGNAADLLKEIAKEKSQLIKEGKIKKEKPLPEITLDEVPFDIPENWRWVRIGSVVQFITSGSRDWAKYYSSEGPVFLRMGNLSKNSFKLRTDNIQHVLPPKDAEGKRTIVKTGDLLFSITGELGNMALIPSMFPEAYINQHTALIRCMPNVCERYVAYALLSFPIKKQYTRKSHGVKNSFRLDDLSFVFFPLPPLSEQLRIVARIEELMARIDDLEKTETGLEKLKAAFPGDMKAALLQAAMQGKLTEQLPADGDAADLINQIAKEKDQLIKEGKIKKEKPLPVITPDEVPFDIPENWKWIRLGLLVSVISGTSYNKTQTCNSGLRIARGGNLINEEIVLLDNDVFLPKDVFFDEAKCIQPKDIVIVASTGSLKGIGRAAFCNKQLDDVIQIGAFLRIVRCVDKRLFGYVSSIFKGYYYKKWIRNSVNGIGIQNIKEEHITNMLIPLPPLAEQKRIVEKLDKLLPLCDGLVEE